jgi:hypothetical protein
MAQMLVIVNNFQSKQGDLVLGERVNFIRTDVLRKFEKLVTGAHQPYFLADINNANGADSIFVEYLLKTGLNPYFYGFSAYNTSANTLGCAICAAVVKFLAEKAGKYDDSAFKMLQFTRLMDDWAYQANVRKPVFEAAPKFQAELTRQISNLKAFEKNVNSFLGTNFKNVNYSLPWARSFEIEVQTQL